MVLTLQPTSLPMVVVEFYVPAAVTVPVEVSHFTAIEVHPPAFFKVEPGSLKVAVSEEDEAIAVGIFKS